MKNWRPVTVLNTVHKIGSSCIANRIKPLLNNVIHSNQTGFIKGRYIGENTRLIYDIMHYTENNNIPGLLLIMDFEKAFDSLSWDFIQNCLIFFNFGSDIRKWSMFFTLMPVQQSHNAVSFKNFSTLNGDVDKEILCSAISLFFVLKSFPLRLRKMKILRG